MLCFFLDGIIFYASLGIDSPASPNPTHLFLIKTCATNATSPRRFAPSILKLELYSKVAVRKLNFRVKRIIRLTTFEKCKLKM